MEYVFDIDGTICSLTEYSDYSSAVPDIAVIDEINRLYDEGHIIKMFTARGSRSGIDNTELTSRQLAEWGVRHHQLIMNKKPYADLFIDDRAIHIDDWKRQIDGKHGLIAGAFDILHAGYISMFRDAKLSCVKLTVAIHEDPSIERSEKLSPVQSLEDRVEIIKSIRYVDDVVTYRTEQELEEFIRSGKFNIRFLGDDYRDKAYTAMDADVEIIWIDRSHGISTTLIKDRIRS